MGNRETIKQRLRRRLDGYGADMTIVYAFCFSGGIAGVVVGLLTSGAMGLIEGAVIGVMVGGIIGSFVQGE